MADLSYLSNRRWAGVVTAGHNRWGRIEARGFGSDGVAFVARHHANSHSTIATVICSRFPHEGIEWIHASIAHTDHMPDYEELQWLHRAAFLDGFAYQMFVPTKEHLSGHPFALHLWGRDDGAPTMPNFGGILGSI